MPGTLFVVATPIGNLEDFTFRALRTLKEVDLIAAEDTRRTSKLLAHYAIRKPMVSLHEHNEYRESPRLVARLKAGESIALVSDAGTPGISDPGQILVRMAHEAGIRVTPIPGPSAVMAALSATGVPADRFTFLGFPPRSGKARSEWFSEIARLEETAIFFEAPHRVARTLSELQSLVSKPIYVHRELTKIHETLVNYSNYSSTEATDSVGEFVVVVGQDVSKNIEVNDLEPKLQTATDVFDCLTNQNVFEDSKAIELAAKATGLDEAVVRKLVKKARISRKRRLEGLS